MPKIDDAPVTTPASTSPAEGKANGKPAAKKGGNGGNKKAVKKDAEPKLANREVVYPNLASLICVGKPDPAKPKRLGNGALTIDQIKDFLGWEEVPEGAGKEAQYHFVDWTGKKIRCRHNMHNRRFRSERAYEIAYKLLNKTWRINGEAAIIGRTRLILSCQHRFIGAVFAEQMRTLPSANGESQMDHWAKTWDGPITLDTYVSLGIPEDNETTRTIDDVLPRGFDDVLYTDESFFNKLSEKDRTQRAKVAAWAVRYLWQRTGYKAQEGFNAFAPYFDNATAAGFLDHHPKVKQALAHIVTEDKPRKKPGATEDDKTKVQPISRYVSQGMASALLYLMGCCGSDGVKYRGKATPTERALDWSYWDRACEFWTRLGEGSPQLAGIEDAIADLRQELAVNVAPNAQQIDKKVIAALLIRAWDAWKDDADFTAADIILPTVIDEDGEVSVETGDPTVGGIDLGNAGKVAADPGDPDEQEEAMEEGEDGADGDESDGPESSGLTRAWKGGPLEESGRKEQREKAEQEAEAKRKEQAKKLMEDRKRRKAEKAQATADAAETAEIETH